MSNSNFNERLQRAEDAISTSHRSLSEKLDELERQYGAGLIDDSDLPEMAQYEHIFAEGYSSYTPPEPDPEMVDENHVMPRSQNQKSQDSSTKAG